MNLFIKRKLLDVKESMLKMNPQKLTTLRILLITEWNSDKNPREWTLKIEGKLKDQDETKILRDGKRFLTFFKKI